MPPPRSWIAVVGPGEATPEELALAEEAGAAVAEAGAGLICGGLGGVMEAACRGARSRGGLTVGLLPGLDRDAANGWVVVALPTGLGEARNALVVRAADAVVAIGGGWGTLSEIALAMKAGVPVVGLRTWELGAAAGAAHRPAAADDATPGSVAADGPVGADEASPGSVAADGLVGADEASPGSVAADGLVGADEASPGIVAASDARGAVQEALRLARDRHRSAR